MRAVRGKDTKPEIAVRRALHTLGYRFRLQRKGLPGRPDVLLPRHRIAIFVHGCFWHRHEGCHRATTPKIREEFWTKKLEANVARDRTVERELRELSWKVVTIWECQTKKPDDLAAYLHAELPPPKGLQGPATD